MSNVEYPNRLLLAPAVNAEASLAKRVAVEAFDMNG